MLANAATNFEYTDEHLITIRDHPHILGHIAGKNKLSELHSDWIKMLWDSYEDEALQAHRGSYKTTAMAVGIIRWLLFFPDDRIAVIRKTFTDAAEVVQMVYQMMEKPGVKALFYYAHGEWPRAVGHAFGKLVYSFKTTDTPEGSVNAHGLDGSLTGKHYDKIWCDDFVTLKDRTSNAERQRTKNVMREIMTNIIDPGKPVMYSGTPWHRDDAWSVVPVEPHKYDIAACGILTPQEIEKKRRTTTPSLFAANYLMKLQADENALFKDPVYGVWDYTLPDARAHVDAAFDGNHTCALTIMCKRGDGFQGVGFIYPGNVKNWMPEIKKLCKKYRARLLYNETNPDKGYSADKMKQIGINVKQYPETQNKHVKICTYLYEYWSEITWDKDTEPEYMNQILDYMEGNEPDDAPDSAASLIREAYGSKGSSMNGWDW